MATHSHPILTVLEKACAKVPYEGLPRQLCEAFSEGACGSFLLHLLYRDQWLLAEAARQLALFALDPGQVSRYIERQQFRLTIELSRGLLPVIWLWDRGPRFTPLLRLDWGGPTGPLLVQPWVWPLLQALTLIQQRREQQQQQQHCSEVTTEESDWIGTIVRRPRKTLLWTLGPAAQDWLTTQAPLIKKDLLGYLWRLSQP
jgi:hypothetical protein